MYSFLFLVRFYPFWAIPFSLLLLELGIYFYNRRARQYFYPCFAGAGVLIITSILWVVFEGFWKLGPLIKSFFEEFNS